MILALSFSAELSLAQGFIWMKGNNGTNLQGTYGTMGVAAPANNPDGRENSVCWTDASGNFWMFGGIGLDAGSSGLFHNDLWKFNTSTRNWTWMFGSNTSAVLGTYGTIGVANAANTPGSRLASVTWTDAIGNLYLFGGYGYGSGTTVGHLNDLWKYDPIANQWTWMKGANTAYQAGNYGTINVAANSNVPGGRMNSVSWVDASGNLWMFGGQGLAATTNTIVQLNDLWKYNISTNQWTWVNGSSTGNQSGTYGTITVASAANVPGGRNNSMSWADGSGNLWLFGGTGYDNAGGVLVNLNDLWKYEIATGNWTWMNGANTAYQVGVYGTRNVFAPGNSPGARQSGITWIDGTGNMWLGFGSGCGDFSNTNTSGTFLNDLWVYNSSSNQWKWVDGNNTFTGANGAGYYGTMGVPSATNMASARRACSKWIDSNNNLWFFGGFGYDGNSELGYLNDVWKYTNCQNVPVITLTVSSSKNVICSGQTVTLSATGASSYTWNTGSTGTSIVIAPSTTTSYTAAATGSNNCLFTAAFSQSVNVCTGIKENSSEELGLYPNPTTGRLSITGGSPGSVLCIYDLTGKTVLTKNVDGPVEHVNIDLAEGMYTYTIRSAGSGALKTGKLLVQSHL